MDAIGPNTRAGIDLAQQGYRRDALRYLRLAVMHEAANAEVWLWLAHVTDDVLEYRNCVAQALVLHPNHATALRMQADLSYQAGGMPPPVLASHALQDLGRPHLRQRRLRRVLFLLVLILTVLGCGVFTQYAAENFEPATLETWLPFLFEQNKNIQFTVGDADEAFTFEVTIPESWYLADVGSPSWREQRDTLQTQFPPEVGEVNRWRAWETDINAITRNPESGDLSAPVIILETEASRIQDNVAVIPNLTLLAIVPLAPVYQDTSCATLRAFAADEMVDASRRESFVSGEVVVQAGEGEAAETCLYYLHFRGLDRESGLGLRRFDITIPASDTAFAVWRLTIPDNLYTRYQSAVETLLESLRQSVPALTTQAN